LAAQTFRSIELKKNPNKDIKKKSGIYFTVGLVAIMLLAYMELE
jgi:hypothetical protein